MDWNNVYEKTKNKIVKLGDTPINNMAFYKDLLYRVFYLNSGCVTGLRVRATNEGESYKIYLSGRYNLELNAIHNYLVARGVTEIKQSDRTFTFKIGKHQKITILP